MSGYSLEELLERIGNSSLSHGWGAVLVISRERVNQMLEQQFTAAFNASRFIAPCSGDVGPVTLSSIVFGAPVLSFESAAFDRASATLTIPLLAGSYAVAEGARTRSPVGISRSTLRAGSPAHLVMDIDLEQVNSDSDNTGRIAIDLAKAGNPVCDLIEDPAQQKELGEFLLAHLRAQPRHKTTYVLGLVDAGGYAPLNPVRFAIRTQAAPGSREPGARNAGDGAVLVFMKLQGYDYNSENFPGPEFLYLIPNDTVGGEPVYTATLIVHAQLSHFVNDNDLAVLKTSMLPPGYAFEEAEGGRYQPYDNVVFGNLVATQTNVRIEPSIVDMEALQSMDFVARGGDGAAVPDVSWTSGCLNSPLLKGEITPQGRFSATGYPFDGPPVLMTTVTARYDQKGVPGEASAFLLVRYQGLSVGPLVSTRAPGGAPVALVAEGNGADAPLAWSLLAPELGSVSAARQPGHATCTPPPAGGVPLVAQRIRASADQRSVESVVMLLTDEETLPVDPPFVGGVFGQGEVAFEVPEPAVAALLRAAKAEEDDVFWRWTVIGEGTVVGDGRTARFSPPASRSSSSLSVLVCEMIGPGVDHVCGYAVVELVRAAARQFPTWESLQSFRVTAPDGVQAFANGMQQIRVQVRIETASINLDGSDVLIPISDVELASLTLVHRTSQGSEVPFIDPNQEGMEHEDTRQWAAGERRNRFNLYPALAAERSSSPTPADDGGVRYRDLYLYLKTDESVEFYAQFRADDGRNMRSVDISDPANESITVKGVPPPAIGFADYEFVRERVWNGEGKIVDDDEFTYMLQSIDFWRLAFRKSGYEPAGFATLKVEGNTSSIQWESELLDETFFSCTGYAFSPKHRLQPVAPVALSFDPYLTAMMDELGHVQPNTSFHSQPPSPGDLIVSLHRESDVTYWYDGMAGENIAKQFRAVLDRPVIYTMLDENGNRHRLQIGFRDPSLDGSRNELNLLIQ